MDATWALVGVAHHVLAGGGTSAADSSARTADAVCGQGGGIVCEQIYDWTGNESAARWSGWFLDRPLKILVVLIIAWIAVRIARHSIDKAMAHLRSGALEADARTRGAFAIDETARLRVEQRTTTLGSVLVSLAKATIWGIALLVILGELGISLGPLIAGAGIAGIAIGFGAQTIVKDFLSGIFMLLEDQLGVGDIVDVGEAAGVVERVTLRTTVLRDVYGTVWHVPNGEIVRVGNKSQLWANALLDIGIAYEADADRAAEVIGEAAHAVSVDPEWSRFILEEPSVLGIQDLGADAVTLRLSVRTEPAQQFPVERELRRRIKTALDEAGIEIPFPQRTVWVRTDEPAESSH